MSILDKLELDVFQACELVQAVDFTTKHGLPAIVVHPSLVGETTMLRIARKKPFKIITTVDWPKGETTGRNKFTGMVAEAFQADGFEIYTTPTDTGKWQAEAIQITEFVRSALTPLTELRFVLGVQSRDSDQIQKIIKGFLKVPTPAFIRTDHGLKCQITRANPDVHNGHVDLINQHCSMPVKISGNVNSAKAVTSCQTAARFAVSLAQATNIVKELEKQPDQLRSILQ